MFKIETEQNGELIMNETKTLIRQLNHNYLFLSSVDNSLNSLFSLVFHGRLTSSAQWA